MSRNITNLFREEIAAAESTRASATVEAAILADPTVVAAPSFGLSAWCILPAIGGIAMLAVFPHSAVAKTSSGSSLYIIFNAAVFLGLSFLSSLVMYFIFGRSRTVASIAFTLAIAVMSATRFAPIGVAGAQAAMIQAGLQPAPVEAAPKPAPPPPPANLARMAGTADTSSLTPGAPTGSPAPVLGKSAKRWVRTATQLAATYRTAREAFENGGGLEMAGLTDRRSCNDRLSLLRRLHLANEAFAGYVNSAPDTLRKLLREDGVLPENIEAEVSSLVTGFDYDLQVSLRQARAEFLANAEKMLQLLRDREGQWSVNKDTRAVEFKSERDTRTFADLSQRASASAAKDLELQLRLTSAESR